MIRRSRRAVTKTESSLARTIVITGAGAGLGRALARRFASEGETVVLLGRTGAKVEKVAAEIGDSAVAIPCDVASPESVRAAFKTIAERFSGIDILINNAGVFHRFEIADATDDDILSTVNINLVGPMLCVREALPLLGRGGHIVNVSSESIVVPFSHLIAYQSSKAGLERFSAGLELELEDRGIRVSTVRAGQMMDEDSNLGSLSPEVARAFVEKSTRNGVHLRERGISGYASVTDAFVAIVNTPADLHIGLVTLTARKPDAR
jgi:meso-butanediol dehydrogenase/(S,S)-butanediol dehydrogenase/diacetyl reductase